MNYELAKKLKEAGFPQAISEEVSKCFYYDSIGEKKLWAFAEDPNLTGMTKCPSLSELIEACGTPFNLSTDSEEWFAFDGARDWDACLNKVGKGSTPEEAVANLWLALNNK